MRIGSLDRLAHVLRPTAIGETGLGETVYEDQRTRTLWVTLIYKAETEEFAASQRLAVRTVTFRSRFFPDLRATDKIECEGVVYDVKGWREIGRREGLEISAEACS